MSSTTHRDFLAIPDFSRSELEKLFDLADRMRTGKYDKKPLAGKSLAMIFMKSSTRTRVSFEVGAWQLGGHALFLSPRDVQLGRGEPIADTARVLSRYVDGIMIRTFAHAEVEELARAASVPVINGLTDLSHPCQLLADMQTVIEHRGTLAASRWAWVGDGNNVCNSTIEAAALMQFELAVANPAGFEPDAGMVAMAGSGEGISFTTDPKKAIAGAGVVVTDTWTSMGHGDEELRREKFGGYQVDEALMALAAPGATFLHCLPAHRGEEVSAAVIDGAQSAVWDEAENRLHAQKALLLWALGRIG